MLIFDEINIKKSEELNSGGLVGASDDGQLHKGIMSFVIEGLMENMPYVLKTLPETKISGEWLMEKTWNCLNMLNGYDFRIRGVTYDNYSRNVSAYTKLQAHRRQNDTDVFINFKESKTFVFSQDSSYQER